MNELEKGIDKFILIFIIMTALVFTLGEYVNQELDCLNATVQSQETQNITGDIKWYRLSNVPLNH